MKPVVAFFIALLTIPLSATADTQSFIEKSVTPALINQLRVGGYVIFMRHGTTDTSRPDRLPRVDLNDCSSQRPLTKKGVREATQVGEAMRKSKIPVGEVISSPMCRAKNSTRAAFGPNFKVNNLLMYTANMTTVEKKPMIDEVRTLLSTPVPGQTNRVLVGHGPNVMDLMGYYPKPEGVVVIFKPLGNNEFEYLGTIAPQQWHDLIK